MSFLRIRLVSALSVATAALAQGQQFPFQLLLTQGNNAVIIQNGGALTFNSVIGQAQTASLVATFTGSGQATVLAPPTISGSTAFTATVTGALPATLNPGASVTMSLQYAPTNSGQSNAQISLGFTQAVPSTGTNPPTVTTGTISISVLGTAPAFVESYILQTVENVVPLQPGGTIMFPPTFVQTTAQAALNLTNTGSGTGTVASISISGSAFRLANLPLFPASVSAGQSLQVLILYTPTASNSDTGQVTVSYGSGSPLTFNIQGSGSSPKFTYQILQTNPPIIVPPSGTITLPNTNVGQTSSVAIQVLNAGNASGTISAISSAGQGFQLSSVPLLPQTLAPNASLTFTIIFAPTQPGTLTGTVIINSDILNLSGVGLGPQFQFSYTNNETTITLSSANNSVVFSPVTISQSAQLQFEVMNTGTLAAAISNIGVGQSNSPFTLLGLPPLPVQLAPGANVQFSITFTPTTLGFSNGTLILDTTSIALIGSGTQPPSLPSYTISGPSGPTTPASQANVSITLASSYPVAIAGTLTLTIAGNLPADPSVQFATGGRTVAFTIPANATSAVFGSQGTQVGVQTGTVASTVSLTPSFTTQTGDVDLTPKSPTILQFTIAPAAPTLSAIQFASPTAAGVTIEVTGFTTTRILKNWSVQFTPAPGYSMPVSQFNVDVQAISSLWFGSTASQAFGGEFTVSVPFAFQGSVPAGQSLIQGLSSVSVMMRNDVGTSAAIQASVQ